MAAPTSYRDPLYASLSSNIERKLDLPPGLVQTIITDGERSNADQVSSAGARTVAQIIPATRDAALRKYGIDAYLSPENSIEVAGRLLKDSLDRSGGDVETAVRQYHGGTDKANWGKLNDAYWGRVSKGLERTHVDTLGSKFEQWMAQNPAVPAAAVTAAAPTAEGMQSAPGQPANTNPGTQALADKFGAWFEAQPPKQPTSEQPGFLARAADTLTGKERRTAETDALPDWATMPELNSLSLASAKTGAGTLLSNPAETADIIKSNFPGAQVRQDAKGNYIIKSAANGNEYAIKPGFQVSDIPRALGALAAFTPAGRATSISGSALAAGATQAVIEGSQAAAGGQFNAAEVGTATAAGGIAPALMRAGGSAVNAVKGLFARGRNAPVPNPAAEAEQAALAGAPSRVAATDANSAVTSSVPDAPTAAPGPQATSVAATQRREQVAASSAAPAARPAQGIAEDASHIWRTGEADTPVKFIRIEPTPGPDDRMYARVSTNGKVTFVPADELSAAPRGIDKTVDVQPPLADVTPAATPHGPPETLAVEAGSPLMGADELAGKARTAALGGFGSKKATQQIAEGAAPDAETGAAARRLGVLEHLQPDHYTTNQAYRQLAQLVKSQTGSNAAVAQREGLLRLAETADGLITKMGGSADLSTLSADAAKTMQATNAALKGQARALYKQVDSTIGPSTEVPAPNIVALIKENAVKLGGVDNLPAVERDLLKRLSPTEARKQPTYALLDKLRKDIGEAKRGKQNAFGNSNTAELTQLENALRADQATIAETAGVGDIWETAQATSRAYKGVQEDMVAIYGKELDKSMGPMLTGAVQSLSKGDTAKFVKLLKATPENMRQEVTASGLASFFQRTSRGGEMDFAGYSRWYDGLARNKQAYAAVMTNLPPEARKQLADLARVAKGVAMSKGEFIATGKALNPKALEAADTMMGRIFDEIRSRGVSGLAAEVAGTVAGAPGLATVLQSAMKTGKTDAMKAADALITSPEFVALVNAASTSGEKAALHRFAASAVLKRYMTEIGGPREMSAKERWVMGALQGRNNARD